MQILTSNSTIMNKKNLFFLLTALFWLLQGTHATVYEGVCGEHLTWTFDSSTGALVIEGYGEMNSQRTYETDTTTWNGKHLYSQIRSVTLPDQLTSIGAWAFASCKNLTQIHIPQGVTHIDESAFYDCSLTSIILPNSVTDVGDQVFSECKQLQSCDLGKGIKHIGSQCFFDCTALTSLKWSDCLETIGKYCFIAFASTGNTGNIPLQDTLVFPATFRSTDIIFDCYTNVKVVVWNARHPEGDGGGPLFNYDRSFEKIIVGPEVEYIPKALFRNQTKIDTLILPPTVTAIGANAFNGCKKLQYLNLPSAVTTIGEAAFYNCSSLSSLDLPKGLQQIAANTFYGCKNLQSLTLPETVTSIGQSAFVGCAALDSIILPSDLRLIAESAFAGLGKPSSLTIPDKVITIAGSAFANWTNLRQLTLGKQLMLVGDKAFAGDKAIQTIQVLSATPPIISAATFEDVPDSTCLSVIPGTEPLYLNDANWSRFHLINLPDTLYVPTKVTVEAEQTTAMFTWPTDTAATTYQIDIYKDGSKFCTLTLDAIGRLLGIAFTPARNHSSDSNDASQAQQSSDSNAQPYALSFLVTGLDPASRYNYVLSALDDNGTPLHVYTGDFATFGYEGELNDNSGEEVLPTPPIIPENPEAETRNDIPYTYDANGTQDHSASTPDAPKIIIRNGQLYIRIGANTYNIHGLIVPLP